MELNSQKSNDRIKNGPNPKLPSFTTRSSGVGRTFQEGELKFVLQYQRLGASPPRPPSLLSQHTTGVLWT